MEAEAGLSWLIEAAPVAERLLQHREGADDVGVDEFAGAID